MQRLILKFSALQNILRTVEIFRKKKKSEKSIFLNQKKRERFFTEKLFLKVENTPVFAKMLRSKPSDPTANARICD